jgi:hypothetical protein
MKWYKIQNGSQKNSLSYVPLKGYNDDASAVDYPNLFWQAALLTSL